MEFLTDCMFVGVEVEGPDKGCPTLYIASYHYMNTQILSVLKTINVEAIYFGAGSRFGISNENVRLIPVLVDAGYKVLLEVNSFEQIDVLGQFRTLVKLIFVSTTHIDVFKEVTQKTVEWHELTRPITSSLNDPLYKEDRRIS
jgi:hypothetical protein